MFGFVIPLKIKQIVWNRKSNLWYCKFQGCKIAQ